MVASFNDEQVVFLCSSGYIAGFVYDILPNDIVVVSNDDDSNDFVTLHINRIEGVDIVRVIATDSEGWKRHYTFNKYRPCYYYRHGRKEEDDCS